MADVECPSCGTPLRNAQPGPDAHIRCPNCGKRFAVAAPASPGEAPAASSASAPGVPPGREPAAGSYGLVLASCTLLLAGLLAAGLPLIYRALWVPSFRFGAVQGVASYLYYLGAGFGLPLLGFACVRAARQFAPADGLAVRVAWRLGAMAEPLPPLKGSSLPYILPFGVSGGLMLLMSLVTVAGGGFRGDEWYTVGGMVLASLLLLFFGLSLGDARRFLWRMEQTALRLCTQAGQPLPPPLPFALRALPWIWRTGVFVMLAIVAKQISAWRFFVRKDVAVYLALALLLVGGAYSMAHIARDAARTLAAWIHALHAKVPAAALFEAWRRDRLRPGWAGFAAAVCYAWTLAGLFTFLTALAASLMPSAGFGWSGSDFELSDALILPGCLFALFVASLLNALQFLHGLLAAWHGPRPQAALAAKAVRWPAPAALVFGLGVACLTGLVLLGGRPLRYNRYLFTSDATFALVAFGLAAICHLVDGIKSSLEAIDAALSPDAPRAAQKPPPDEPPYV